MVLGCVSFCSQIMFRRKRSETYAGRKINEKLTWSGGKVEDIECVIHDSFSGLLELVCSIFG